MWHSGFYDFLKLSCSSLTWVGEVRRFHVLSFRVIRQEQEQAEKSPYLVVAKGIAIHSQVTNTSNTIVILSTHLMSRLRKTTPNWWQSPWVKPRHFYTDERWEEGIDHCLILMANCNCCVSSKNRDMVTPSKQIKDSNLWGKWRTKYTLTAKFQARQFELCCCYC